MMEKRMNSLQGLSRGEVATGWILGVLFLAIFILCPNVRNNHDAVGWAMYLDEYASAPGNLLWPTEQRPLRLYQKELTAGAAESLGGRQLQAGWWVLWNPHHLLYLPVTAVLFRIIRHLIPMLGGMTFLQFWNSILSAASLMLIYRLLARVLKGSPYVIPWILFLGSSVTFFHYATDGAQYPTPVLFLALASGEVWAYANDLKPGHAFKAGIWLAIAVLFHQIVSLAVPFFSIAIWLRMRGAGRERPAGPAWLPWIPLLVGMGIPVAFYLVVGAIALGPTGEFTIPGILKYATLYAREKKFWSENFLTGFYINLMTYVGFFFGNPRTQSALFSNVLFTLFGMILPAFWIVTALQARKLAPILRWWAGFNALWILPFFIFLSFWVPGNDFYHLFMSIPLSFFALIGVESLRRKGRNGLPDIVLFWVWCVVAIAMNLPFTLSGCKWFAP
jgi:hypothetical protein